MLEGSSVITARPEREACGLPGFPNDQYEAKFVVAPPDGGVTVVTEQVNECTLPARVVGSRIVATDVECEIAPNAVVRQQWGLFRKRYSMFEIDAEHGTWKASSESWRALADDPNHHSCQIGEGRLVAFKGAE